MRDLAWLQKKCLSMVKGTKSNKMSKQIVLDTKLVGDINGDFYVPSYQRGYRWGETEVVLLLSAPQCAPARQGNLRKLRNQRR